MVVTLATHGPGELDRITPLVAHLTPSYQTAPDDDFVKELPVKSDGSARKVA